MLKNKNVERYDEIVENIFLTKPNFEVKVQKIINLNEDYLNKFGKELPEVYLEKLGSWLLSEVYGDKRTNKAFSEEYPVLSDSQEIRRRRKLINIQDELILESLNYHKEHNLGIRKKE